MAIINGEVKTMDVMLIMVNERTLVPLRVISETLGFEVEWNSKDQEIRVFSK